MNSVLDGKNLPRWNDPSIKAGTKIRTALWLLSEVGVGNVFTKEQHRHAFPGVSQADRRLRDLRTSGWVIHTSLNDVSLNSNEQRFVAAGSAIWNPMPPTGSRMISINAKLRRAIFAEAGYQCTACGIAGGENYPDSPWMSAILSITTRISQKADGTSQVSHIAECKRCQSGEGSRCNDITDLILEIRMLSDSDRQAIACMINQAPSSALLKIWAKYRQLSPADKLEVRSSLSQN